MTQRPPRSLLPSVSQVGGAGFLGALLPFSASIIAVLMGLNLLELIRLELPSLDSTLPLDKLPPSAQAFLLGADPPLLMCGRVERARLLRHKEPL